MQKAGILFFLIFSLKLSYAQTNENDGYRGTINVKRKATYQFIRVIDSPKPSSLNLNPARANFRIVLPKKYNYKLIPVIASDNSIILVDRDKKPTDNVVRDYSYEVIVGNCVGGKSYASGNLWSVFNRVNSGPGSGVWISELSFTDAEGNFHQKEIGEFKIEKIN